MPLHPSRSSSKTINNLWLHLVVNSQNLSPSPVCISNVLLRFADRVFEIENIFVAPDFRKLLVKGVEIFRSLVVLDFVYQKVLSPASFCGDEQDTVQAHVDECDGVHGIAACLDENEWMSECRRGRLARWIGPTS